jgi:hypothetical protein
MNKVSEALLDIRMVALRPIVQMMDETEYDTLTAFAILLQTRAITPGTLAILGDAGRTPEDADGGTEQGETEPGMRVLEMVAEREAELRARMDRLIKAIADV